MIVRISNPCSQIDKQISIFSILKYFSSSDTLHDLKGKIAAMNPNSSFSDSFQWKNLATGKMIDPTKLCADIATGQERTHKFSSPKNIKWVSFE